MLTSGQGSWLGGAHNWPPPLGSQARPLRGGQLLSGIWYSKAEHLSITYELNRPVAKLYSPGKSSAASQVIDAQHRMEVHLVYVAKPFLRGSEDGTASEFYWCKHNHYTCGVPTLP
jgi:hypothetical protein